MAPLSTISALAQGLMRRSEQLDTHDVRDRGEKIWRASLRLRELIDTIMSYTRANANAITLNPCSFNLKSLVGRVCQEQGRQAPNRTFNLDIEAVPDDFTGDPILLEQALVIVLSNAMKYSPSDQPITIIGRTSDGETVITIKDRGIGVPERDLPFLMQPFFRGSNAKHMAGTGLGLSLAWHILRLHGGALQIESEEGRGTAVTMILPVDAASETDRII